METQHHNYISRDPGPLILEGIYAATLASLLRTLGHTATDIAVADLSLGAWRAHHVASEFCTQLGLTPLESAKRLIHNIMSASDTPDLYDDIGVRIDAETSGDRSTLIALDLATQVAATASERSTRTLLVFAPRYRLPWENENLLFIRFLIQGLRGSSTRLILACADSDDPIVPKDWVINWLNRPEPVQPAGSKGFLELVPGVVEPEVAAAIEKAGQTGDASLLPLADGSMLVAPEGRRSPYDVSRSEYDQLAIVVRPRWLKAYAQFFGKDLHVKPWLLCIEAQKQFAEGSYNIALRLMERAISCCRTPMQRAICQAQVQGLRIALHRFREAAEVPDPSPEIPQVLRRFLLQAKGWALVMLDDSARAELYLREARDSFEGERHGRGYLYLLNISALNWLKLGNLEGALALEREIEASHSRQANRDWHLEYVNSINIARLHRRRGDTEIAERYYQRAFATTLGARSESDAIYTNICWAKLNKQRGRLEQAFLSWIRASLHWASSSVPEALSPRVAMAILGRKLSPTENIAEEVSAALASSLLASATTKVRWATSAVADLGSDVWFSPVFVRVDQVSELMIPGADLCAVGAPGWSILATQTPTVPQFVGRNHRQLRSLLYGLLKSMCPGDDLADLETIVIDDRFGREIPKTRCELLETCVRLRIPKMVFGTEIVKQDRNVCIRLEKASRVQLASAVDRVEFDGCRAYVTFKRYFAPKILVREEGQILTSLDDQPSLEELAERLQVGGHLGHLLRLLRSLEQTRMVNVYLPDKYCEPS